MKPIAARYDDLKIAIAGCCDRLVSPLVGATGARAVAVRLVGSLILSSFVVSSALALSLPAASGAGGILAGVCATLALFWLAALQAASGRALRLVGIAALAGAAIALPVAVSLAGGLASPMALLLAGLLFEPLWVARARRVAYAGCAALAGSLGMLAAVENFAGFDALAPSPWFWLPVLAYCATMLARIAETMPRQAAEPAGPNFLEATQSLGMRLAYSGEVLQVEGDARAVLGVPPEHLLSVGFFERILVGDRVAYMCALGDVRDGAPSRRLEALVRVPTGSDGADASEHRSFEISLHAMNGEVFAIVRQNAGVQGLRTELAAAQERCDQMAVARNRLLASVSHELRTPLNAIIGFSDMLLLELFGKFGDPRQKEYVSLVRDSGTHLLEIVNSILDVSKIESGAYSIHPEAFPIADAIGMCRSMMDGHARAKAIALRAEIEPGLSELTADRRAVQQMLINLVSNAIKFTPEGGAVAISARRVGSVLALSVSDNGIGIAEGDLARLGEPFTQIDNSYTRQFEGTGLGLSLVKGLVGLHGGRMEISSAPGEGTSVTIMLPLQAGGHVAESGKLLAFGRRDKGIEGDGSFRKTA